MNENEAILLQNTQTLHYSIDNPRDKWEQQHWNNKDIIIMTDTKKVTTDNVKQERGKTYGKFADNAFVTQQAENVFKIYCPNYENATCTQKEALHMILQKLSRCFCGNTSYEDNWVDIVGYSKCVIEDLQEIKEMIKNFSDTGEYNER